MQSPYVIIIIFSLLIIFSYVFTQISKLSKIPSVIFLIGTGIGIQFIANYFHLNLPDLNKPLHYLGIVGLIMIVLEGALDLKLEKEKIKMIFSALATSILILGITNSLIALVLNYFLPITYGESFLSAIPLSVVSSAIVIPSVHQLIPVKREFMILESTLSDIFGIMLFTFWLKDPPAGQSYFEAVSLNIGISVVVSILLSYVLVYVFQKITTEIKFFLFLAILALLFAVGEYFHYSALLIILIFGIVLNNPKVFYRGFLKRFIDEEKITPVRDDFVMITNETSFLIRTFFFIVFGITMNLNGLFEMDSILIATCIMAVIFITRAINLKVFLQSSIFPQMLIAPRGLVTILLFKRIIDHNGEAPFSEGILALVIIGTNLTMMLGLIASGSKEADIQRKNVETIDSTSED